LRGGKGVLGMATKEEDIVQHLLVANNHDTILYFTNKGRVFSSKAFEIMQSSRQSKGQAVVNLLQIAPDETITGLINISDVAKINYLLMATKNGLVKKTPISAFTKVRKSGLIAIKLRKDDELKWVKLTSGENQIIIVSKKGQSIRFWEKDCRPMGRSTTGIRGIKLRAGDEVIGMDIVRTSDDKMQCDLLIITERGTGKKTALSQYNIQRRGGIGLRTAMLSQKTGNIIQMQIVDTENGDLILISCKGQVIRLALKNAKRIGRATCGVRLMKLKENDKIAAITIVLKDEAGEVEEIQVESSKSDDAPLEKKNEKSPRVAKTSVNKTTDKTAPKEPKKPKKLRNPAKNNKPKKDKKPKEIVAESDPNQISFSKKPIAKIEPKVEKPKSQTPPDETLPQFTKRKISEASDKDGDKPNYWDAGNWQRPKE
jgi:hypothetical protein